MPTDRPFLDSLTVRHVGPDIDLTGFTCASEGVVWFLRNAAVICHRKQANTTTCWMDGPRLAGYVTLRTEEIVIKSGSAKERFGLAGIKVTEKGKDLYRFPSVLIAMLGVCTPYCRKGLAREMVLFSLGHARSMSKAGVGCRFVRVDSEKTDAALGLYRGAGFVSAPEQEEARGTESMYFDMGERTD
ncbi:MAG: hypothetical protein AUH83_11495 [Deltaproteobacteria bacterium 13_1_40CM_4_68_19]|nr:MAG: hypothetical protein AUH83_11495 [Deltaproteobacteria bacterium 13_1_40CM_4_68_19]